MQTSIEVNIALGEIQNISAAIAKRPHIMGAEFVGIPMVRQIYHGDYTITPTDSEQILQTAELVMAQNVRINPIPSNYGKITYNGAVLTVS